MIDDYDDWLSKLIDKYIWNNFHKSVFWCFDMKLISPTKASHYCWYLCWKQVWCFTHCKLYSHLWRILKNASVKTARQVPAIARPESLVRAGESITKHASLCCVCLLYAWMMINWCQVSQWIGERLSDPYRYKYLPSDNDMPLHKEFQPTNLEDRWEYVYLPEQEDENHWWHSYVKSNLTACIIIYIILYRLYPTKLSSQPSRG